MAQRSGRNGRHAEGAGDRASRNVEAAIELHFLARPAHHDHRVIGFGVEVVGDIAKLDALGGLAFDFAYARFIHAGDGQRSSFKIDLITDAFERGFGRAHGANRFDEREHLPFWSLVGLLEDERGAMAVVTD